MRASWVRLLSWGRDTFIIFSLYYSRVMQFPDMLCRIQGGVSSIFPSIVTSDTGGNSIMKYMKMLLFVLHVVIGIGALGGGYACIVEPRAPL